MLFRKNRFRRIQTKLETLASQCAGFKVFSHTLKKAGFSATAAVRQCVNANPGSLRPGANRVLHGQRRGNAGLYQSRRQKPGNRFLV